MKQRRTSPSRRRSAGFTLAELAIVVAVIALLLGGLLMTVSAQNEQRQVAETRRTLENAREALIGFAVRYGRLPCPAPPPPAPGTPAGPLAVESFTAPGATPKDMSCAHPFGGYLPAVALGLSPTNQWGYLIDAWGNEIRYAVAPWVHTPAYAPLSCPENSPAPASLDFKKCPAFTTANGLGSLGMANLPGNPATDLLRICDTQACTGVVVGAPAVVWSTGKSFVPGVAPVGADQVENATTIDRTFVAHEPRAAGATGGEFDDILVWLPAAVLYSRLAAAGAI